MAKILSVKLNESSYYTMIRSVIESWPKEVMGEIYGKEKNGVFFISNAYQFVTAARKPTSVSYGNYEAVSRLRSLDELVKRKKYFRNKIVGGFHSHVINRSNRELPRSKQNSLSTEDLEFIKHEMASAGASEWIEVLIRIERKEYSSKNGTGKSVIHLAKKMKILLKDKPTEGYDITFSAFYIDKNMKVRELKVRNGAMTRE